MPRERQSITHKFSIAGHEGYITAGTYEDGTVGEIFLTDVGKEGSTLRGMMNAFATSVSIALQYGVPLETLVRKFSYMRFDPEGITGNPEIPFAKSMPDYIMRWLGSRFLDADLQEELGILTPEVRARKMSQEALMRGDTAGPANGGGNGGATAATAGQRRGGQAPGRRTEPETTDPAGNDQGRGRGDDRRAAGAAGEAAGPGPGPGVWAVRRDDAADGLLLHVLELREQHGLRLKRERGNSLSPTPGNSSSLRTRQLIRCAKQLRSSGCRRQR